MRTRSLAGVALVVLDLSRVMILPVKPGNYAQL